MCNGLPKKAARDPQVDKGCPCFLLTFMGSLPASRGRDERSKILGRYEANPNRQGRGSLERDRHPQVVKFVGLHSFDFDMF